MSCLHSQQTNKITINYVYFCVIYSKNYCLYTYYLLMKKKNFSSLHLVNRFYRDNFFLNYNFRLHIELKKIKMNDWKS